MYYSVSATSDISQYDGNAFESEARFNTDIDDNVTNVEDTSFSTTDEVDPLPSPA